MPSDARVKSWITSSHLIRVAKPVRVPTGTLLTEAARLAGIEITQPCGGQGRCGRCAVQVTAGQCAPPQHAAPLAGRCRPGLCPGLPDGGRRRCCRSSSRPGEDRAPADHRPHRRRGDCPGGLRPAVLADHPPCACQPALHPAWTTRPTIWSRLQTALRQQAGYRPICRSRWPLLRKLGDVLREADWQVTAVLDAATWDAPECPARSDRPRCPGTCRTMSRLWGAAIDIGTTTVTLWLVDLISGQVQAQVAEYNGQIARGEDVISRIIYASKNGGSDELRRPGARDDQRAGCERPANGSSARSSQTISSKRRSPATAP